MANMTKQRFLLFPVVSQLPMPETAIACFARSPPCKATQEIDSTVHRCGEPRCNHVFSMCAVTWPPVGIRRVRSVAMSLSMIRNPEHIPFYHVRASTQSMLICTPNYQCLALFVTKTRWGPFDHDHAHLRAVCHPVYKI